ncbi:MAG: SDR family oxidoreductase [Anaerolineae bacterium]|jgi:3-oxoacyl-[acyl-carrier protein] reductase|nr:SDR family oxidoreductase [Anaerolineae bacterium]
MHLLQDKVALITGSGRGIGAATAKLFAQHGAKVIVNDLDPAPAEETAHQIIQAGGQAIAVAADVTDAGGIEELVGQTVQAYQGIDILVNNAGYTWDGMAHKMSEDQWNAMLAIHLTAPFKLIQATMPYMREAAKREKETLGAPKARKIINVSSTSGTRGNVGQLNYAAGKAGIIGLTKTLSKEWGLFNIQVNAVAFGFIETRLTQADEQGDFTERQGRQIKLGIPDQMRQMAFMMIPMGRAGTPEEAAGALLFFASPLSDYVSGQVLEVTGGL